MSSSAARAFERAAQEGKPVAFDYLRRTPVERADVWERRVIEFDPGEPEPVRENQQGERYVIGRDLARDDVRSFKLKQIDRVEVGP